jgi:phosphoribosylglycinamide formyltransferase-1
VINLAFLASNNGTSLRAIVEAIECGALEARARVVVSNRRDAPALEFGRAHGLRAVHIPTLPDPAVADERLAEVLLAEGADLVVLSGYLRKLGPRVLATFRDRILNVHPALLPNFGGEGMYGLRVHEAVLAAGASVSGATVHLVDDEYDHGPVVAQAQVPVLADDTPLTLQARVMAAEPALFVQTLQRIVRRELDLSELSKAS